MMKLRNLFGLDTLAVSVRAADKRGLLEGLVRKTADQAGCDAGALLEAVLKREGLGSTGIGEGVAIPHARLADVKSPVGALAVLSRPIDFAAIDGRPVDIVALLALPNAWPADALQIVSLVTRCLRKAEIRADLRRARDPEMARVILSRCEQSPGPTERQ